MPLHHPQCCHIPGEEQAWRRSKDPCYQSESGHCSEEDEWAWLPFRLTHPFFNVCQVIIRKAWMRKKLSRAMRVVWVVASQHVRPGEVLVSQSASWSAGTRCAPGLRSAMWEQAGLWKEVYIDCWHIIIDVHIQHLPSWSKLCLVLCVCHLYYLPGKQHLHEPLFVVSGHQKKVKYREHTFIWVHWHGPLLCGCHKKVTNCGKQSHFSKHTTMVSHDDQWQKLLQHTLEPVSVATSLPPAAFALSFPVTSSNTPFCDWENT